MHAYITFSYAPFHSGTIYRSTRLPLLTNLETDMENGFLYALAYIPLGRPCIYNTIGLTHLDIGMHILSVRSLGKMGVKVQSNPSDWSTECLRLLENYWILDFPFFSGACARNPLQGRACITRISIPPPPLVSRFLHISHWCF